MSTQSVTVENIQNFDMYDNPKKRPIASCLTGILIFLVVLATFYTTYFFLGPKVDDLINSQNSDFISSVPFNPVKNTDKTTDRGLRTAKIKSGYEELPKDIVSEVVYRDVRLISTSKRQLNDSEIKLLEIIIDSMPQKLFDYRPWAIVSTKFDAEKFLAKINAEGVAFTSGPYVLVGDITFEKQESDDSGTYRGLMRVMSHEFTHVAQFFNTTKVPDSFINSYLESSDLVKSWTQTNGWKSNGTTWTLDDNEITTDYGKSNPVEDMADAVGSLVIGDEYSISLKRTDWILKWMGVDKETLFLGTLPLSNTIKQRKVESSDTALLKKYSNETALLQDILNFQSTVTISTRDLSKYYAQEFQNRGWNGKINASGIGEFTFQNKYKVDIEMDKNPLRVVTVIMTVY